MERAKVFVWWRKRGFVVLQMAATTTLSKRRSRTQAWNMEVVSLWARVALASQIASDAIRRDLKQTDAWDPPSNTTHKAKAA